MMLNGTPDAEQSIAFAEDEARRLGDAFVGSEHLLLGLARQGRGAAGRALSALGVSLEGVRLQVADINGRGPRGFQRRIPYTERMERLLLSAAQLDEGPPGTEHLLVALVREDGVGALALRMMGLDLTNVLERVEAEAARGARNRVFLCHSSGDKELVRALYYDLRRDGFQPWFDEVDLLPGQDWEREIRRAIRASRCVLACLSKTSVSKAGYVQKEIRQALDVADEQPEGAIFLIPVRLEECGVPDRLRVWQWVDLYSPDGYRRLRRSLQGS